MQKAPFDKRADSIQRISPNLPWDYPTDADAAASRTGGGWRRSPRGIPSGTSEGGVLLNGIWQNPDSDHSANEGMGGNLQEDGSVPKQDGRTRLICSSKYRSSCKKLRN